MYRVHDLIREAYWQSMQALIEAYKNDIPYADWHPVFGIL
jgi:hypothetical protein